MRSKSRGTEMFPARKPSRRGGRLARVSVEEVAGAWVVLSDFDLRVLRISSAFKPYFKSRSQIAAGLREQSEGGDETGLPYRDHVDAVHHARFECGHFRSKLGYLRGQLVNSSSQVGFKRINSSSQFGRKFVYLCSQFGSKFMYLCPQFGRKFVYLCAQLGSLFAYLCAQCGSLFAYLCAQCGSLFAYLCAQCGSLFVYLCAQCGSLARHILF